MTNTVPVMTPTEMLIRLENAIMENKLNCYYYNNYVVSLHQYAGNGVKGILIHFPTFTKFIPADELNFELFRITRELPLVEWQALI